MENNLTRRVGSLESSFGDPFKLTTQKVGQKSQTYIVRVVRKLKSDDLGVFHKVSIIHSIQAVPNALNSYCYLYVRHYMPSFHLFIQHW
jgi:hypothetical protein